MRNLYPQLFFDGLLDLHKSWVAVFQHLTGVKINKVVVLPELVGMFVLGSVVAKLVLDHQIAVEQQLHGVVQGGATDAVFVVFHPVIERLDVEMPVDRVDLLKDGKPLRGFSEIVIVKIIGEYLLDSQQ